MPEYPDPMDLPPPDLSNGLGSMAAWLHEFYTSCLAAGFSEDQAFQLTGSVLVTMLGKT